MHYAYCPCDAAIASLNELRGYDYELQPKLRIMNDEITSGADILGALLMGHSYNSWWCGSDLSIEESRRLVPHQNATTMQVAISVVAALMWMIENPNKGVCVPDELPHDFILEISRPYLGNFISTPSDWTPLKDYVNVFDEFAPASIDTTNPWQFKNFLVGDRTSGRDERARKLAHEHGTPLFVVDHDELRKNYAMFKKHLPRVQVYYAVKANSDPAIVKTFYKAGASMDVASMAEFHTAYDNINHCRPNSGKISSGTRSSTPIRSRISKRSSSSIPTSRWSRTTIGPRSPS